MITLFTRQWRRSSQHIFLLLLLFLFCGYIFGSPKCFQWALFQMIMCNEASGFVKGCNWQIHVIMSPGVQLVLITSVTEASIRHSVTLVCWNEDGVIHYCWKWNEHDPSLFWRREARHQPEANLLCSGSEIFRVFLSKKLNQIDWQKYTGDQPYLWRQHYSKHSHASAYPLTILLATSGTHSECFPMSSRC